MDGNSTIHSCRSLAAAGLFWLLFTWAGGTGLAATINKCIGPTGKATYSDQPCAADEEGGEVDIHGQPLIGGPGSGPDESADPKAVGKEKPAKDAEEEPQEDVRAPRIRRLDFLLNQLLATLNSVGDDCKRATTGINTWIKRHGNETRELYADWNDIKYEKLTLKQKELEAMRSRLNRQVARLKNESLPKLNAKCWNDRQLGAAFDRLQPYLPGS